MSAETFPPPEMDAAAVAWWDATREHRLTVQACGSCEHRQHPPRAVCTSCGRTDQLTVVPASGDATVDSWTEVHRALRPDVALPYVVARVRLAEGPILLTRLDGSAPWEIGEPVTVDWFGLPDGRALPVFGRP